MNVTQAQLHQLISSLTPDLILDAYGMYPPPEHGRHSAIAVDEVEKALEWLKYIQPIKTINTGRTSYGYKHCAEGFARFTHENPYVSNGAFIAGALIAGFKYKLVGTPNCRFNFSEKSVKSFDNYGRSQSPEYMEALYQKQFLHALAS